MCTPDWDDLVLQQLENIVSQDNLLSLNLIIEVT